MAVIEDSVREEQFLHDMCLLGAVTVEITQILTRAGQSYYNVLSQTLYWRKYIWTPLKMETGLVIWWSVNIITYTYNIYHTLTHSHIYYIFIYHIHRISHEWQLYHTHISHTLNYYMPLLVFRITTCDAYNIIHSLHSYIRVITHRTRLYIT